MTQPSASISTTRRWRGWLKLALRIILIGGILVWMFKPIVQNWDKFQPRLAQINPWNFVTAALMFAVFLLVFRVMVWRRILAGMGYKLSGRASIRCWSFSELARYLPGAIWQVVGRVYLTRPYGVSGSVSSASQLLELAIFMLANLIVAIACLAGAGLRQIPEDHRFWIYIAMGMIPVLLSLIHPRIFYGLLNGLLRKLGKPEIEKKLPKRLLTVLVSWNVLGLLWQAMAIWILTQTILPLELDKWYVLAGAYCLAWTIGFSLGALMPGGIGVREFVFVTTLGFFLSRNVLPPDIGGSADLTAAFLKFLGLLLRLWNISGELLLALVAYVLNRGRVPAVEPAATVGGAAEIPS